MRIITLNIIRLMGLFWDLHKEIMDTQYLGVDIAQACTIIFTLTISAMFLYWWTLRTNESKVDKMRSYAQGLKLEIHNTEGLSVFEAVADQLRLLNPQGSYTADMMKQQTKKNETTSFLKKVRRILNIWIEQEMWKGYLEELNAIADTYKRIIEVVHCDRKETTVIRPDGTGVTRHMQTAFIGYAGQGRFYSLKPESDIKSVETSPTGNSFNNSNSMVKSNFLIGDGTAQYVIGLPIDQDKEHTVTKNIVIGNNTSQNILATFRTSKELIDFVLEMESSGTEGSEHRLRLKIRESSNTLSDEQLREKHKHIIEMFEDKSSEVRRELDEELKSLSLIYEKSSLECILLNLKVDTIEKLNAFVTRFRAGDLEKIMVIIAKQCHTTSTFDVQLHLSVNLSATEREKISTVSKYIDRNPKERTILKPKSIPSGFSLVVRKKADRTQGHLVSPETLTQKVAEATVASLSKTHLLEDTSGIDFHFEKFCSLKTEGYTKKPSRDAVLQYASNTMSESMRGCVGVIHVNGVQAGTCFRVGSKYIMTAFHVVKAIHTETCDNCLDEQKVHVEFPDEDEKHLAKMVYFDEDIDVAVLSFVTENSERTSLNRVMTCHPGQSFYTISYLKSQRKTRRSLIASTDYTTRFSSSQLVIFDSDDFEYGCSGSPGIITNVDGETGFLTMLLGSFTTDTDAWYYGVKMTEVKKRISKENPFLANELFGLFDRIHDQKTPFHHEDWRTIKKVDKNNSTHLRQRLTRRINGS